MPPLVDRARAFSDMLTKVAAHAAPHAVHGGTKKTLVYTMASLGVKRAPGLSRRPVLLGGPETERALH